MAAAAVVAAAASADRAHDAAAGGLQARLEAKQREAEELKAKIQQRRLLTQSLKVQLQSAGVAETGFVPGHISSGAGGGGAGAAAHPELRSLLEWLADCVDLARQVNFECGAGGAGVAVGGRRVLLQRMAAMPLGPGNASKLQLSVPLEMLGEVTAMLQAVRGRGGRAGEAELARVAQRWEIVAAEMVSAATGQQEPAIFLVHRGAEDGAECGVGSVGESPLARAIVVAQWPSVDFAQAAALSAFSPERHFQRLASSAPAPPTATMAPPPAQQQPQAQPQPQLQQPAVQSKIQESQAKTLQVDQQQQQSQAPFMSQPQRAPQAQAQPQPQQPQQRREEEEAATARQGTEDADVNLGRKAKVCRGDRVVICYQGKWFRGVLERVDVVEKVANVKCDSDSPGVITIVPLGSVWPASSAPEDSREECQQQKTTRPHDTSQRQVLRHVRAKTVG